jgi:hypothetical protein
MPLKDFLSTDPADFVAGLTGAVIAQAVSYASATQALGTVPANSLITTVRVVRTTKWDAITAFEVGKSGDTDWLCSTAQANVDGTIDSGEAGAAEVISSNKIVTTDTALLLTLDQGAASAGAGCVVVEYVELSR